jgi:hypothetical protein
MNTYTLTTLTPTEHQISDQHGNIWSIAGNTRKQMSAFLQNLSRLTSSEQKDMLGAPTIKKKKKSKAK